MGEIIVTLIPGGALIAYGIIMNRLVNSSYNVDSADSELNKDII